MKAYNIISKEMVLDNGLQVLLVQKPGYYRSLCTLATGAGGFDLIQEFNQERIYHKTGCAHYLEHQMFRLNGEDVSNLFAANQASTNAFTTFNKTAYYFQTTADFEQSLYLLLDFVETLDIDEASIEKERGIILSEYDMYDQQPEQKLFKQTWKSLYASHPIRNDVLGSKEDIRSIRVEDLERFYALNYDPSRLILIVVTGHELDEVSNWIVNHQKKVSSKIQGKVKRIIEEESMEVNRPHYEEEMDISIPYVSIAYKLKPEEDIHLALRKDYAIQSCLDALMSPLNPNYQKWLDKKIITQLAGAECDISCDHAYLVFYAQTPNPKEYIELINQLCSDLSQAFSIENYEALKAREVASNIRGLDHFENLAIELLEAKLSGYSYWERFNLSKTMTRQEMIDLTKSIDLSHKTITTIQPKSSK